MCMFVGIAWAGEYDHRNCVCRANNKHYTQGQVVCLFGKLARCEMNLNNPSWKIILQSCPESRLNPLRKLLAQSIIPLK